MTRSRIVVINLISWTLGILAFWAGNLVLRRFVEGGVVRTILYFVLLGVAVTIFGGTYGLLRPSGAKKTSGL